MSKLKIAVAALGIMMFASFANAAPITFGLQGGVSVPMGDFGDLVKLGPQGGVFADFWAKEDLAIGADLNGSFHKAKDDYIDALEALGVTDPDFSFDVIQFGLHGKWMPKMSGAPAAPWLAVGAAMYNGKAKIEGTVLGIPIDSDDSESKFGFNVSGGLNFKANDMFGIGVMAAFHNVTDAIETDDGSGNVESKSAQYVSVGATINFSTTPK